MRGIGFRRATLTTMTHGATEIIGRMIHGIAPRMGSKGLWLIGHTGIIDACVTRDASVHHTEGGHHILDNAYFELLRNRLSPVVNGFLLEDTSIVGTQGAPIGKDVLTQRRGREITKGNKANNQQSPLRAFV